MKKLLLGLLVLTTIWTPTSAAIIDPDTSGSSGAFQVLTNAVSEWQSLREELLRQETSLAFETNFEFPSLTQKTKIEESISKTVNEITALRETIGQIDKSISDAQIQLDNKMAEWTSLSEIDLVPLEGNENDETESALKDAEKFLKEQEKYLTELGDERTETLELVENKTAQIKEWKSEIPGLEETHKLRLDKQEENLYSYTLEIERLKEEVLLQKEIIYTQLRNVGQSLLAFIIIVAALLGLIFGTLKLVARFTPDMTSKRREALLQMVRIIFNVVIGIVILTILFAQFVNLVPFLLLLGTGIAFAVRDSIASFIGWFVIGTDRGFRLNDFVQIGDTLGKVREITPITSLLLEYKDNRPTGRTITFPNKFVFEKELINCSRMRKNLMTSLSFHLDKNSDLEKAEKLLGKVIHKFSTKNKGDRDKLIQRLVRQWNLNDNDFESDIWLNADESGPIVQARFFCPIDELANAKNNISREFLHALSKEKDVSLRA